MKYIAGVIWHTWWQVAELFAVPCVLAVALQWVGAKIRRNGVVWLGSAYWYLVAPGVACHETGHALGCLMTGTKIVHFEPFRPNGNQLGCVIIERKDGNPLWRIAEFAIGFGPVWFGCLMIWSLTRLFSKSCSRA